MRVKITTDKTVGETAAEVLAVLNVLRARDERIVRLKLLPSEPEAQRAENHGPRSEKRESEPKTTGTRYPGDEVRTMKTLRAITISLALTVVIAVQAQPIPANDVANALDALKLQAAAKIDQDLEVNARAFADARNIQGSAFWSDLFGSVLDIARAVYDGLTAIPTKSPNLVRSWVKTSLWGADTAQKVYTLVMTGLDRFWQDGQNLQLAIDGPAYTASVNAMLDRADDPWFVSFDYESYRLSILNDLTGIAGSSPMRVVRKSATVDRTGGQVLPTVYAAKNYIYDQLRSLSTEMRQRQLPQARITEIAAFIEARRRDLLNSRAGNSPITYSAYLLKGSTPVLCPVSTSLGTVTALERWRITMLGAYTDNVDVEIRVRLAETADTGLSLAADTLTEMVSFNLSYEATIAGQAQANEILKDAATLGFSIAKPDVGSLFNMARTSASNAREQINMIPQQMMDALPGEVSKVLLLVDDTIQYVRTMADPPPVAPAITSVSPSTLTGLPLPQTQLIRILGSGFTSSSALIFNGSIASDPARLKFINANELDYSIAVGPNAANWTVKVINGGQQSNLGTFTVTAPPPNTGSLTENLSPPGAVSAGAQWRVDGSTYHSSGDTVAGLSPGSHTVSFTTVAGYTTPAAKSVYISSGLNTSDTSSYTVIIQPNTGSLVVTLYPAGAVSAGAQWRVDSGSYRNNGDTATGLTPGPHTVSFKTVAGYTTPADKTATIASGVTTSDSATYTPVVATTYTLNINSDHGQVYRNPNKSTFSPGESVRLSANNDVGWHFDHWSGDASGTTTRIDLLMDSDKTVTANWASGDASLVTITMTLLPAGAAAAGARWRIDGEAWQNSGQPLTGEFLGDHYIEFLDAPGWFRPAALSGSFVRGDTNLTATYTQDTTPGSLMATLTPPDAGIAGAKWRVNGGSAQSSGASLSLPPGTGYTVTFDATPGWTPPASQNVEIRAGQTAFLTAAYSPPAGQPVIAAIRPSAGPLAGGTALTIDGVNFVAPVAVLVGDHPATNIVVLSPTQIACLTPSNSVYGSVSVAVQTAGGSVTNLSGFRYGNVRSTNMELAGQIGGTMNCVAISGDHAFIGQGPRLVVMNISTPSNPALVEPGLLFSDTVNDIAISGNYACLANNEEGLQVVDISIPSAPQVRGFCDTPARAKAVALLGGRAYVADGVGGLQVLDIATPAAPRSIGALNWGEETVDVAVAVNADGVFVYLSLASGGLRIVDVTTPTSPVLRGLLPISDPVGNPLSSVAVSGNRVYVASDYYGLAIIDVSNADAPSLLGRHSTWARSLVLSGGNVYLVGASGFQIVNPAIPGSPTEVGRYFPHINFGYQSQVTVSGQHAFVAGGTAGFVVFNIANPATPTLANQYRQPANYVHNLTLTNDAVFLATDLGVEVADTTTPDRPWIRANLSVGQSGRIALDGGRAYCVTLGGELDIVTIVSASQLSLAGAIPQDPMYIFDISPGSYEYVVGGDLQSWTPQLKISDLADPANPIVRATLTTSVASGIAYRITKRASLAYLLEDSGTLRIVDVSQSSNPILRGSLPGASGGYGYDFAFSADGQRLFVGTSTGFNVIDVTNPDAPSLQGSNNIGSPVFGLDVVQNLMFATSYGRVLVLDITDPLQPVLVRSYATPTFTTDVSVQGDYVYAACGSSGLLVLKLQDVERPEIFITNPTFSPQILTSTPTLDMGGAAQDNKGVIRGIWANDRGGGGEVNGSLDNWFVSGIALQPGTNILTVTVFDQAGNTGSDALTVMYQTPKQNQTITFPAISNRTFGDAPVPLAAAASSGLPVSFSVVSGPASLSNNVLSLLGAGAVTVQASQPGNDFFNPALPVDVSFDVAKGDQGIAFAALPDKSAGDPPFALNATASSGLPVSFEIVSGPAVLDTNVVTLLGGGVVTVSAWQPGNSNFKAAVTVQRSFNVAKLAQSISFGPLSRQTVGDAPFPLAATASSGLPVTFTLLSGPAQLAGNIVTMTEAGLVVLRASQSGDATYAPAPNADQVLIVVPGNNVITDPRRLVNGMFTFRFYGEPGTNYVIQASTNLVNWLPLATNQISGLGYLEFTDTASTSYDWRFYRIAP